MEKPKRRLHVAIPCSIQEPTARLERLFHPLAQKNKGQEDQLQGLQLKDADLLAVKDETHKQTKGCTKNGPEFIMDGSAGGLRFNQPIG